MSNTRELFNLEMWTLLSDRESARISLLSLETHYKITMGNVKKTLGFPKGSVYWQTVTVCQLEIIGRPCKKYLWALAHCRNLLNSAVIVALLYRASGVCQQEEIGKTCTYFANGLPITSNWQTVTVCQ